MLTLDHVLAIIHESEWSNYAAAGIGLFALVKALHLLTSSKEKLPPSLPGEPILGHARLILSDQSYRKYADSVKTSGDVISTKAFGQTILIANTLSAARELLNNKEFSGRQHSALAEIAGWSNGTPFLQNDDELRIQRKLILKYLSPVTTASPAGKVLQSYTETFLQRLLERPELFFEHIQMLIIGTVVEIVYGRKVTSVNDLHAKLASRVVHLPGKYSNLAEFAFDSLPFLRYVPAWVPGTGVKRRAITLREDVKRIVEEPFEEAKARKVSGDPFHCMVSDLLYDVGGNSSAMHETILKHACFSVYNAGCGTPIAALLTFFLFMVHHPEVVAKAQLEIDSVIGSDPERLPTPEDRSRLPYIKSVLKELYRINPVAPLGLAHSATQDVQFRNWKIPKGTLASPNIWKILRDEQEFPDPDSFQPDRYETSAHGKTESGGKREYDPSAIVFGFGKRLCPGMSFSDSILLVTFARILAVYDIRPYKDPVTGVEELPEIVNEPGILRQVHLLVDPQTECGADSDMIAFLNLSGAV